MFEHRQQPMVSRPVYLRRLLRHAGIGFSIVVFSLVLGVAGYGITEGMGWVDALLKSSMLLGGMGPVTELRTTGGKLFASGYALYSGLVFLIVAGVLFAPVFHRFLHHFHLDMEARRAGTALDPHRKI